MGCELMFPARGAGPLVKVQPICRSYNLGKMPVNEKLCYIVIVRRRGAAWPASDRMPV